MINYNLLNGCQETYFKGLIIWRYIYYIKLEEEIRLFLKYDQ